MNRNIRFWTLTGVVLLFVISMAFAPYMATHDPFSVNVKDALQPMSSEHFFGTDQLGRDVYSRILYGGQVSLSMALIVVVCTTVIGGFIGLISAYVGGKVDAVLSRITNTWLSMPEMVVAIALIGILGPSVFNVLISLILVKWAEYARVMRSLVLYVKSSEYIRFAHMSGASTWSILKKYILPNVVSPLVVVACQHIGEVIITIAGFSLIGIGVQPPTPEWGSIMMNSKDYMQIAPWLLFFPGAAIFIAVVLFNWWGDELRDVLDPRVP